VLPDISPRFLKHCDTTRLDIRSWRIFREAAAQEAIQRDEQESADAEKQGAAALIEAKEALKGRDVHEKQVRERETEIRHSKPKNYINHTTCKKFQCSVVAYVCICMYIYIHTYI
jgi:hypothetical protein